VRIKQGKLPFDDENIRKLLHKVKSGVFTMPQFLHRDLQDLISKMLTVDPEERISIHQVRQHAWYLRRTPRNQITPTLAYVCIGGHQLHRLHRPVLSCVLDIISSFVD
jgi:serine/threonine protein kinase